MEGVSVPALDAHSSLPLEEQGLVENKETLVRILAVVHDNHTQHVCDYLLIFEGASDERVRRVNAACLRAWRKIDHAFG